MELTTEEMGKLDRSMQAFKTNLGATSPVDRFRWRAWYNVLSKKHIALIENFITVTLAEKDQFPTSISEIVGELCVKFGTTSRRSKE